MVSDRKPSDYIALALIRDRNDSGWGTNRTFSGDPDEFHKHINKVCGFAVPEIVFPEVLETLNKFRVIRVTNDDYTGTFLKIDPKKFNEFIESVNEQHQKIAQDGRALINSEDFSEEFEEALLVENSAVIADYLELGNPWLDRALKAMKERFESGMDPFFEKTQSVDGDEKLVTYEVAIPASDRIVSRVDNQQEVESLEAELLLIAKEIDENNEVGGKLGDDKELFKAELDAAQELTKHKRFRLRSILNLVWPALRYLSDKFAGAAIGDAAKRLIALLLNLL